MPNDFLFLALNNMQSSSKPTDNDEHWPTFEEILQSLHNRGIYIHSEQLAEFMLVHGLPVHPRYVPERLQDKAIRVNQNYQGDMARPIEELEHPDWDYSWMPPQQISDHQHNQINQDTVIEELEQPSWDYP
ncbi:hypothetical protein [Lyngbya aestuarii]|uniref:hypothetical protein n=1 Tax=Lyngbya aestuarii TaxID=118322 RepID=UPI00403D7FB3